MIRSIRWTAGVLAALMAFAFAAEAGAQDRPGRGKAEATINGKKVTVEFGRPSTEGAGYKSMEKGAPDGYVWRMGSNQRTKLTTEGDLKFGDVSLKAGSYSLYAQRKGEGWNILVHPKADGWGMPVEKEGFIGTIELKQGKAEKAEMYMNITVKEADGGGELCLAWGDLEGKTKFTVE